MALNVSHLAPRRQFVCSNGALCAWPSRIMPPAYAAPRGAWSECGADGWRRSQEHQRLEAESTKGCQRPDADGNRTSGLKDHKDKPERSLPFRRALSCTGERQRSQENDPYNPDSAHGNAKHGEPIPRGARPICGLKPSRHSGDYTRYVLGFTRQWLWPRPCSLAAFRRAGPALVVESSRQSESVPCVEPLPLGSAFGTKHPPPPRRALSASVVTRRTSRRGVGRGSRSSGVAGSRTARTGNSREAPHGTRCRQSQLVGRAVRLTELPSAPGKRTSRSA
jgi:hypothetical protein